MKQIAIIGQGYVGLPLAIEFAQYFSVIGYDINDKRIHDLAQGMDVTLEADVEKLHRVLTLANETTHSVGYKPTSQVSDLTRAQIYIITVPTPIDQYNAPDLSYLVQASRTVAQALKPGDIVIYESTVYPGCTEEDCAPVLEKYSGLKLNTDFFVGYSPERINPGDKVHTLPNVVKITSGSTPEIADEIDQLYKKIIKAGTYKAGSIQVAEAAKVIENAQRDVNISFVNELSLVFDCMGIDTHEVLDAASTKYNFLKYKPGLVGGHCISVDPYYLAHKAITLGYVPEVILSGRRVNNKMGQFIASKTVKLMLQKDIQIKGANILILGLSFKENCRDIRNTKVISIYKELLEYGTSPDVCDPWVDENHVAQLYNLQLSSLSEIKNRKYDAIIVAVAHDCFLELDIQALKASPSVIFDCKAIYDQELVDCRL